jgi:hypothetical protein
MARSDIAADALERPNTATPISDAIRRRMRTRAYIRAELVGRRNVAEQCGISLKPADAPWRFL